MKHFFFNHSLKFKLMFTIIVIIGLISVTIFIYFPHQYKSAAITALKDKARSLAEAVAFAARSGIEFEDQDSVKEAIQALGEDPDIINAFVFNHDKKIYGSLKKGFWSAPSDFSIKQYEENNTIITHQPIGQKNSASGLLILILSMNRVKSQVNVFRLATLLISILVFIVGSFLTMVMVRPLLKQVQLFQSQVPNLAKGDLTVSFPILYKDEIGLLLDHINNTVSVFKQVVLDNKKSADSLLSASGQIENLSQGIRAGAINQETSMSEISVSMEESHTQVASVSKESDRLQEFVVDASSSILQMLASGEEVLQNTSKLENLANETTDSIVKTIDKIKNISDQVQVIEEAISSTSSAVSEIEKNVHTITVSVREGMKLADDFTQSSKNGLDLANEVSAESDSMALIMLKADEKVENLSGSVAKIIEYLNFIRRVSSQTNLLALNASIIAAQAGEKGKSFAVVADEIGDLADRTKSWADQIQEEIDQITTQGKEMETVFTTARKHVESVRQKAHLVHDAQQVIYKGAGRSRDMTEEASGAIADLGMSISHIQKAVEEEVEKVESVDAGLREWIRISGINLKQLKNVLSLTTQIVSSMREQTNSGDVIKKITEELKSMATYLKNSMREQESAIRNAVRMVEVSHDVTEEHLNRSNILTEESKSLREEADRLQGTVQRFKT